MIEEEARALYAANPDLMVRFVHYYKYVFDFAGENDLIKVEGQVGGDANDIYREDITGEPFRPKWNGDPPLHWMDDFECWRTLKITDKTTGDFWEREWDY
jgi:hypothetical protein